jgi:hypothetical protein
MATYVNNLRLTELATGEGSGTWGTTTNTNLELIGEALGHGSETIANASTHTITVADGTSDSARSFYLVCAGGGQACTVTLAPNTLNKVWMIENTTSYTLTFSQGSGANVAVAAGQVKMIATNGAGAGAVVYDLLTDVDLTGTTTAVNVSVSGTLGVTGVLTATSLDISGDIDVDGTTNLDVVDIDGAVDMASTLGVTGVATLASLVATTADINGGTIDATVIGGATAAAVTGTTVVANTSVNIAGDGATVTGIKDEDNMASNSATKLATQQSIKAYVDAQVGTVDTLSEVLAIGNTTGATDIDVDGAQKVQFRDAAIYINSSVDGQLDIVADTEIQIAATTVDINGTVDVSGTVTATGTSVFASPRHLWRHRRRRHD